MRATINFEVEVGRVPATMRCLVLEEAYRLNRAVEELEAAGTDSLANDIEEALERLDEAAHQLRQYKDMLLSFERAKLEGSPETTSAADPPGQPIHNLGDLTETLSQLKGFDAFVQKMTEEEVPDDDDS